MSFTSTSLIFVPLVFIGGIFLVNMILAVLCDGFQQVQLSELQRKLVRMHLEADQERLKVNPVPWSLKLKILGE